MALYIATVRLTLSQLGSNTQHDPKNKITGACPVTEQTCTDKTGWHHSYLVEANTAGEVFFLCHKAGFRHVTRVELAKELTDVR